MASFFRPLKYALQGHDIYRLLIHEATENDDNQPGQSDLDLIVKRSHDFPDAPKAMTEILRERLEGQPKKWRRALKAMTVLECCVREGPRYFIEWAYSNVDRLKSLRQLEYVAEDGTEVAAEVRAKAKEMVPWILARHRALRDRIRCEGLEEELRREDLRQDRLQKAARLRQEGSGRPLHGTEPPSYSKVLALDRELQSEGMRQERLQLAAQLRREKEDSSAHSHSSSQAGSVAASRVVTKLADKPSK